jgi:hypothetical protein
MTSKDTEEACSGYLRKPHNVSPVLYLVYPDGTKQGLCRVCANRWLLSDEEWPPKTTIEKSNSEDKRSTLANTEIPT